MARKYFFLSLIFALAFCVFTVLLTAVDVRAIGPNGSAVGFAGLNSVCRNHLPYDGFCYEFSESLGYVALGALGSFILLGVLQLYKTRSIRKVEPEILCFGFVFILTAIFYVLFDKVVVINMRPVLENGVAEPSYPSSHTLLSVVVFVCTFIFLSGRKKGGWKIIFPCLAFLTVLFRLMSGVHWVTDILGGLLLSFALVFLYKALVLSCEEKKVQGKKK